MAFIYKIENMINHKLYIGKTLYTIDRRWKQHNYNVNRSELSNIPLYSAMRKYGKENFSIFCVEEVMDESILSEREKYWIAYYNTYKNGYNATIGGDGSLLYDYEYIWELWESGQNIKQIASIVGCCDQVVQTVLNIHGISTEERILRSKENIEKVMESLKRGVYKLDVQTNEIIEKYNSVTEAADSVHADSSNISKLCKKSGIGYGFRWIYSGNDYTKRDFTPIKVCQIDLLTNEVINTFNSTSEAARAVDGDSSYISKVCRGIYKSSKGYGWKFLDDISIE